MKSFFFNLSSRFPFFANRPSALERAVRPSPKSRRLRMEPLENRALLAVDAFGASAFLASDVGESWGPDPAPVFSASVLATNAAIVDVSGIDATSAAASFSVQVETPTPVAPPSFDQLMEALGMIEIESLNNESDAASLSFLDAATDEIAATSDATVRRVVFEGSDVDAESLDEPIVVVPLATVGGESAYNGARSGGESGNSGGEEDLKPFLSGGYGKAGYADFVFSADGASVYTFDVSGWFTNPAYYLSSMTYSVVDENLDFVDASFSSASTLQISLVDDKIGKGSFTVRATNSKGFCDVTINVYSGRVVGYALEEKVWGGDWGAVEDSESGANGWNLLWRENEYRWTPIFDGGVAPEADQIRTVAVRVKTGENETTGEDDVSDFANATYNLQYDSGGSDATAENIPNPWPCVVGIPSGYGEKEIAMSVTLSGADISDNSKYCVATSNNVTLTQKNTEATVADRPRVAITEVQSVTWEAPEVIDSRTGETIVNAIRLSDDPNRFDVLRCFPEEIILDAEEGEAEENDDFPPAAVEISAPEREGEAEENDDFPPTLLANTVNTKVMLATPIPQGMVGTVHLQYYDPLNTYSSLHKTSENAGESIRKACGDYDNNGDMGWADTITKTSLTFTSNDGISKASAFVFTQANAGDNVILAAHPNNCLDAIYEIRDLEVSGLSVLYSPYWSANNPYYFKLCSPELTVWRTLWVECDQMSYVDEDNVTVKALKPEINEVMKPAFNKANIDVVEYSDNTERVFSGFENLDFSYTEPDSEGRLTLQNSRNSPSPRASLWTVRIIGGFWYSEDNDVNEIRSGITIARYGNNAFVFNDSNKWVVNRSSPSNATEARKQEILELRASVIAAHEVGHWFLGANNNVHTACTLMASDITPVDINDVLENDICKKILLNFNDEQIQAIQARNYPM